VGDSGDSERIPRLRLRVERLIERQVLEHERRRREQRVRVGVYVTLIVALLALGAFTAYLDYLLNQATAQTAAEIRSVRRSVDAVNEAIAAVKQKIEENNQALEANHQTLQLHRELLARALAETRTSNLLSTVDSYLTALEGTGELEFEGPDDRADVSRKLKDRIRPVIVNEIVDKPELTDAQLRRRIERLADRYLDDF
jgi:hypothetical protein